MDFATVKTGLSHTHWQQAGIKNKTIRAFSILVEPLHFLENVSTSWELSEVYRIGQRM